MQAWPNGQSAFVSQSVLVTLMQTRLPYPSTLPQRALQYSPQSWQLKPVLIWKQPPWTHTCPAPQHVPLQRTAHVPPQQPWPVGQAFPQAPQLAGSVWRLAHVPLQQVCPLGQFPQVRAPPQPSLIVPHWPGWQLGCGVQQFPSKQIWSRSQVLSQIPQFSGSFWRLVHSSPQQTSPSGQHSSIQQVWLFGQQVAPQQPLPAGQHTSPQQV